MRQKKKIYLVNNILVKRSADYICNTIYGYGSKIQVLDQETAHTLLTHYNIFKDNPGTD